MMTINPVQCPFCRAAANRRPANEADTLDEIQCDRCGTYLVEAALDPWLDHLEEAGPVRRRLGAATRRDYEAGRRATVTIEDVEAIAATVVEPRGVLAKLDRLLELLADQSPRVDAPSEFTGARDYPLGPFEDGEEVETLLGFAADRGWFDLSTNRLTLDGWARADALRARRPSSRYAFVAMSFRDDLRDVFDLGFRRGIEASQYFEARRVDLVPHNDKICDRIIAELRHSALVVADATYLRPNVFFEAGWAYGLGVPVIWTCRKRDARNLKSAFDTRQYNHLLWESAEDLAEQLDARIRATVLPVVG